MKVQRISEQSLKKILDGETHDAVSVIKFYSLGCDFCHALSEYYTGLAEEKHYADINFFAYNVDEDEAAADALKLNGVPSIALVSCRNKKANIVTLKDPVKPPPRS